MLVNIEALLRGQGADFRDVLSAVTYVKHPRDAARLPGPVQARGPIRPVPTTERQCGHEDDAGGEEEDGGAGGGAGAGSRRLGRSSATGGG